VSAPRGRAPVKLGALRRHSRGGDALDQVGRSLGHPPAGTRRTKPPPLATEGQQRLVLARVTAEPQKAMRQDAALQVVVKFPLDIGRQTWGIGISVEHGEKGLEMVRDHLVEHPPARITGFVGGHSRSHACILRPTAR
jgi:hypothetical protein